MAIHLHHLHNHHNRSGRRVASKLQQPSSISSGHTPTPYTAIRRVARKVELRRLAVERRFGGDRELRNAGLKELVRVVLGKGRFEKPTAVTTSRWDNQRLSGDQVCYACLDAFCSFEIARVCYYGS